MMVKTSGRNLLSSIGPPLFTKCTNTSPRSQQQPGETYRIIFFGTQHVSACLLAPSANPYSSYRKKGPTEKSSPH